MVKKVLTDVAAAAETRHLRVSEPSPWVRRFAALVPASGWVLDLASGNGRNARHFLALGYRVVALDRTVEPLADLARAPGAEVIQADLEDGSPMFDPPGPLAGRTFAGIVVTNYLYRPILTHLVERLTPGGVLIYETFARGNERFTRPRNPDFLLKSGELLDLARGRLQVVAYEHGIVERDSAPAVVQRLAAVNDLGRSARDDGEPEPHPVPLG